MRIGDGARPVSGLLELNFEQPPVAEVVIAVSFEPISGLALVDLGLLWDAKFRESFPFTEEQPPFEMPIERFPGRDQGTAVSFQLTQRFPRPRVWFLDEARVGLVQIQDNWFARNWRRMPSGGDYPRFASLRSSFEQDFQAFIDYVDERELGEVKPTQCELTYINHITAPAGEEWGLHDILSVVARGPSSLPTPESARFSSQYIMSEQGLIRGRLYVTAEQAVLRSNGEPVTVMTLTTRGEPLEKDLPSVLEFMDLGRQWIARTFMDATQPKLRTLWRQRNGD